MNESIVIQHLLLKTILLRLYLIQLPETSRVKSTANYWHLNINISGPDPLRTYQK